MSRIRIVAILSALLISAPAWPAREPSKAPKVQFSQASSSGEEATTPVNLAVVLSAKTSKIVSVNYAATGGTATGGGVDYTLAAGTLTIPANTLSANIAISVVNDNLTEPDETIVVTLSNPSNASLGTITTHTYTIAGSVPQVSFNTAASFGIETLRFSDISVSLNPASTQTVSVNWALANRGTAKNGTDFSFYPNGGNNGTLTFAPGEMLKTIRVESKLDNAVEGDESFRVYFSSVSNAGVGSIGTHTFTIYDSPPRGIEGDHWADVVLGQRDFTQSNSNRVVPNHAFNVSSVVVDRSTGSGIHGRAYVWDAGNNRILGFDLSKQGNCYTLPAGTACTPDIVIGQPSGWDDGACNRDASTSRYPYMAPASAETLCGTPTWRISQKEGARAPAMAVDPQTGDLYVPDFENNRVLIFNNPFTDTSPAIADDVLGQDDFSGVYCNKVPYKRMSAYDGDIDPSTPIAAPTASSLCAQSDIGSQGFGVALDTSRNLWVADGGNNRVLRFLRDPVTQKIQKSASLVLGQPNFTSRTGGTGLNKMQGPSSLAFGTNGNLYVADGSTDPQDTNVYLNSRVLVFVSPFTNGMAGTPFSDSGTPHHFRRPLVTGVSGVADASGLWITTWEPGQPGIPQRFKVQLFNWDGTLAKSLPQVDGVGTSFFGPVDVDKSGNVLVPGNRDVSNVFVHTPPYTAQPTTLLPPSGLYNIVTNRHLTAAHGIATANNQLYLSDWCRILVWNNLDQLTNEKPPDSFIGQANPQTQDFSFNHGICYGQMKTDASARLWVASQNRIFVFQTPLYTWSKPIKVVEARPGAPIGVINGADSISALGTAGWGDFGFVPSADGNFLWISQVEKHRVLRIRNPLGPTPLIDVVLGQADFSGTLCNQDGTPRVSGPDSLDRLCFPWNLSIDHHGNLYVSDHQTERQGNLRMLMFDASLFTDITTISPSDSVLYAPPASKEFPANVNPTYEPAFDSTHRMVVGYDAYVEEAPSFMGIYDDPLSSATDPTSTTNPTCNPSISGEDCLLNDHMVLPYAVTFDAFDNLYIGDPNRSKVFIYKRPFNTETGATPDPIYPSTMAQIISLITAPGDDAHSDCAVDSTPTITNDSFTAVGACPAGSANASHVAGLRFNGLAIPRGATIDNAVIIFRPTWHETDGAPLKVRIKGVSSANPAVFSPTIPLTSQPSTAAVVDLDDSENGLWKAEHWHSSPNLKAIVQEIINLADWKSGNSMAFLISNNGTPSERLFLAFDSFPTAAPILYIQYH
jgi:hypothetical protein